MWRGCWKPSWPCNKYVHYLYSEFSQLSQSHCLRWTQFTDMASVANQTEHIALRVSDTLYHQLRAFVPGTVKFTPQSFGDAQNRLQRLTTRWRRTCSMRYEYNRIYNKQKKAEEVHTHGFSTITILQDCFKTSSGSGTHCVCWSAPSSPASQSEP